MCRAQHVTNADLLSAMFAGSQATSAHQPRQRVSGHKMPSEKLAEFNEERAAKRARTAAFAAKQLAHPPRPFVEDADDEDDVQPVCVFVPVGPCYADLGDVLFLLHVAWLLSIIMMQV